MAASVARARQRRRDAQGTFFFFFLRSTVGAAARIIVGNAVVGSTSHWPKSACWPLAASAGDVAGGAAGVAGVEAPAADGGLLAAIFDIGCDAAQVGARRPTRRYAARPRCNKTGGRSKAGRALPLNGAN